MAALLAVGDLRMGCQRCCRRCTALLPLLLSPVPRPQDARGAAADRGRDDVEGQDGDDGSLGSTDMGYDDFLADAMAVSDAADEPSHGGQVQTKRLATEVWGHQ